MHLVPLHPGVVEADVGELGAVPGGVHGVALAQDLLLVEPVRHPVVDGAGSPETVSWVTRLATT